MGIAMFFLLLPGLVVFPFSTMAPLSAMVFCV
jgi:hypothetical protein